MFRLDEQLELYLVTPARLVLLLIVIVSLLVLSSSLFYQLQCQVKDVKDVSDIKDVQVNVKNV